MADEMETCTVLVVGAGLSGVCAAKHLEEYGVDTIVLEASDRIGGRLHTVENEHVGWTDVGGAYAGPSQDRILKLIRELGLSTFKVYEEGDLMHYRKGHRTRFSGILLPPMHNPAAFLELNNALRELDRMVAEVPLDEPWKAPKAREWDSMTFAEWCRKSVWTKNARASVYQLSRINICAEPYEISLLFTLWYIGSAGGIARINSTEGGAQERKVLGGTQQIPKGVAKQLKGGVRLNEAVSKIEYGSEGCEVYTKSGRKYSAQYVILAIPPAMHSRIEFSPPVPSARTQLCQRTPMGSIIKTMTYYPRAYWREQGISGSAVVEDDDMSMPVDATMDDCKPDGSFPCIMGFVLGEKARVYSQLSKGERKRKIAQSYKKLFGIDEMANPIHFEEKDWNADEWCGGAYTGFMGPGVMSQMGDVLREPIGVRLFLAGTETATRWAGYMDGAVLAGRRAAREVLARLRHIRHHEIGADEVAEEMPVPDLTDTAWLRYIPSAQGVVKSTVLGGVLSALIFMALRREDGILSTPMNWINKVIKKF